MARGQPICPHSDEMATIRPWPASRMCGTQARAQWKTPARFTSRIRQKSASLTSSIRPIVIAAALATSTSTGPSSWRTRATIASTAAESATSAGAA